MLHRRLLYDDALGVDEALNEIGSDGKGLIASGVLRLIFDSIEKSPSLHRQLSLQVNNQPLIVFTLNDLKVKQLRNAFNINLPDNIHLLTLMNDFFDSNAIIVRLEHFYEKYDHIVLSKPVGVDLKEVFGKVFQIDRVDELALGANMKVSDLNERLEWISKSKVMNKNDKLKESIDENPFLFSFSPMQIRTFRIFLI